MFTPNALFNKSRIYRPSFSLPSFTAWATITTLLDLLYDSLVCRDKRSYCSLIRQIGLFFLVPTIYVSRSDDIITVCDNSLYRVRSAGSDHSEVETATIGLTVVSRASISSNGDNCLQQHVLLFR